MDEPVLVSACLLGLNTRYDGTSKRDAHVDRTLADRHWLPVPVCPEQLGGLSTPRPPACIVAGDAAGVWSGQAAVIDANGTTTTPAFIRGAQMTLAIARRTGCRRALLKERSPSCGVHQVYRRGQPTPGRGVTAELLQREGLELLSEEDL